MTAVNERVERTTKPPPHDLEAEEALLGAMLLSTDAAGIGADLCAACDFYKPAHGHIFGAITALRESGVAIDAVTVMDELKRRGVAEQIGDPSIFVSLHANTPSITNASNYARIVATNSRLRRFITAGRRIVEAGQTGQTEEAKAEAQRVLDDADPSARSSWDPVDLRSVELEMTEPTLLEREDRRPLLYAGKVHSLSGEPEAGKSHIAMALAHHEIALGNQVVFIDYETDAASVKERMLAHGCRAEDLYERFTYIRPEQLLAAGARHRLLALLVRLGPSAVVIDGVAEALALEGLDENQATDVTTFLQALPRACAGTGAAVLMLDHVIKDAQSRGRYARGSGAKLAGVDVAFKLVSVKPFAPGHDGESRLEVAKDRYGLVRALQVGRAVGMVRFRSLEAGTIAVEIHPPTAESVDSSLAELRPSARRVLAVLEGPNGAAGLGVPGIGDLLAFDGAGKPLKKRTIQDSLKSLRDAELAEPEPDSGLWHSTRAHQVQEVT
jgi:hypothetical protein